MPIGEFSGPAARSILPPIEARGRIIRHATLSWLLFTRVCGETVWKIVRWCHRHTFHRRTAAINRPLALLVDSWRSHYEGYPDFPNSFGREIPRTSPITISTKLNFHFTEFSEVRLFYVGRSRLDRGYANASGEFPFYEVRLIG